MTRAEILAILRRDNPHGDDATIVQYADVFADYAEARANIAENGNIALHPRTGAPIANPYLSVKSAALQNLRTIRRPENVAGLWQDGKANAAPETK